MQTLHVVALVERVDDGLPVRVDDRRAVRAQAHALEVVRREQRRERVEEVEQRFGVAVEVDEHEAAAACRRAPRRSARSSGRSVNSSRSTTRDERDRRARTASRGTGTGCTRRRTSRVPSARRVPRCRHALWNACELARRRSARRAIDSSPIAYSTKSPACGELLLAARDLPHARPQPLELEVGERGGGVALLRHEAVGAHEPARRDGHVMPESDMRESIVVAVEFNLADLFELVADAVPRPRAPSSAATTVRTYAELDERATRLAHALDCRAGRARRPVPAQLDRARRADARRATRRARCRSTSTGATPTPSSQYVADDADLVQRLARRRRRRPRSRSSALRRGRCARRATSAPRSGDDHYVLYTGGTTGRPKGVVWRQEDIFFAALGGGNPGRPADHRPRGDRARRSSTTRRNGCGAFLPPDEPGPPQFVSLALGPLVHASGQWSALGTLLGGGKVVLYAEPHVDMERVLDLDRTRARRTR